jgi:hypothetical protein
MSLAGDTGIIAISGEGELGAVKLDATGVETKREAELKLASFNGLGQGCSSNFNCSEG